MVNLNTIENNVKLLLMKYPVLRSIFNRKRLIFRYWQEFEGVGEFGIMEDQFVKLTNPETISRAVRKVQSIEPGLKASPELEHKRYEKAMEYQEYYKKIINKK
jgi:hypothetical protein